MYTCTHAYMSTCINVHRPIYESVHMIHILHNIYVASHLHCTMYMYTHTNTHARTHTYIHIHVCYTYRGVIDIIKKISKYDVTGSGERCVTVCDRKEIKNGQKYRDMLDGQPLIH